MPMDAREIESLIKAALPDATVEIRDLAGDGDHYAATVTSAAFQGKSRVHGVVVDVGNDQGVGRVRYLSKEFQIGEVAEREAAVRVGRRHVRCQRLVVADTQIPDAERHLESAPDLERAAIDDLVGLHRPRFRVTGAE